MSWGPAKEAICRDKTSAVEVELVIEPRVKDLGGFSVRRILPSTQRRMVGPFIFLDHMGPVQFRSGEGINVRPHPHINLATVTYLFEGEIDHRDSLGSHQLIRPGAINWMTAGRGIVHSERTRLSVRERGADLHGIQSWLALPEELEETAPEFFHHPDEAMPRFERDGAQLRLLAGKAYGYEAPVKTFSPMFYADVQMSAGSEITLPDEHHDRAAYIVDGTVRCGGERCSEPRMLIFVPSSKATIRAETDSRVMLLGGEPFPERRYIWWNFVSTSERRIEQAKLDWKERRFAKVPGDEDEFTPLPE